MNWTYTNKILPLAAFLVLGMSSIASAQEERGGDFEQVVKSQPQPVRELVKEGESYTYPETTNDSRTNSNPTSSKENSSSRDTASIAPSTTIAKHASAQLNNTKQVEKKAVQKEDNESVLSFNFLYYIIQRFKLSDIIE